MRIRPHVQKIGDLSSAAGRRVTGGLASFWRIVTLSLGDDRVAPKSGLAASLYAGGASIAYGSRLFSKIKIKGLQLLPASDAGFTQPETLASALVLARSKMKGKQRLVILGIPKAWVVMTRVELPATVKENLFDVVSYELDRLTPLSSEEALYDYRLLKEEDGKVTLMLAAAKADMVNPYLQALREQGMSVSAVTVNLSADGTLASYIAGAESAVFAEVDGNRYEGALLASGFPIDTFAGRFNGETSESRAERVLSQAKAVIDRAGLPSEPQFVLLLNDSSYEAPFKSLAPRARLVVLHKGMEGLSLPAEQNVISYPSIGALLESLWPRAQGLNLLGRGYHPKTRPAIGLTLLLLVALAALGALYVLAPLSIEGKRVEEIDRQIALRKDEARKVEVLRNEVEGLENEAKTIAQFKKGKPLSINLIKEITTTLPPSVWLSRLRIGDTSIDMEGYAPSASELLSKLEASPYLKKVEFASPTFRDARMNADRFIIRMEIEGITAKEKGKGEVQQ
jgi:Tfp pilus assembly protein PilN